MNTRFLARFVLSSCIFAGLHADGASVIYGLPVTVAYSASAPNEGPVTQTTTFAAMEEDFIALGPDSIPLFDVSFEANQLTITALRTFTVPPGGFMKFTWNFTLAPANGLSFSGADLISSSLFSIPPFTSPVNPPVSFVPKTDSISIGGPIVDGPSGTDTVNDGGSAVIGFTVVPEPSTWALLATGTGAKLLLRRRARP